jgi:hypothetical protein
MIFDRCDKHANAGNFDPQTLETKNPNKRNPTKSNVFCGLSEATFLHVLKSLVASV